MKIVYENHLLQIIDSQLLTYLAGHTAVIDFKLATINPESLLPEQRSIVVVPKGPHKISSESPTPLTDNEIQGIQQRALQLMPRKTVFLPHETIDGFSIE